MRFAGRRDTMNYNKLKVFFEVAKTLNQSRVARELYMCQSTISTHILDLEADLKTALFVRSNRDLKLTAAGRELYEICTEMFPDEREIYRRVWDAATLENGNLRIAIMGINIAYRIPELYKKFTEKYPAINLEFERLNWDRVLTHVERGKVDVGIKLSLDETYPEGIDYLTIARNPLGVIMLKNHRLAAMSSINIDELKHDSFLMLSKSDSAIPREITHRLCRQAGFDPKIVGTYENSETIILMVQAGTGISVMSHFAPMESVSDIVCIPINGAPEVRMDIIRKKESTNAAASLFVDIIREMDFHHE
jgi:DNA-binding transcriptional LysR family regulator